MRKTHSYLKGLSQTRARIAGEIERYEALVIRVQQELDNAKAELAACDLMIKKFDKRLDPTRIEPVRAWQGKYGKRGDLGATILWVLKEHHPAPMSTVEVALLVQTALKLDFATPAEFSKWQHDSIGRRLQHLAKAGYVVRSEFTNPGGHSNSVSWCLLVPDNATIDSLFESAEAAGLPTVEKAPRKKRMAS